MTPSDRSKRLHNFTLPYLRWGQQKFLRCVRLDRPIRYGSPSQHTDRTPTVKNFRRQSDDAPGNVMDQGKLGSDPIFDRKFKISAGGGEGEEDGAKIDGVPARPWNLRTRRAACNEPKLGYAYGDDKAPLVVKMNDDDIGVSASKDKIRFCISLLKEEINNDFVAMIGKRPPRRPRKRPRTLQKQLNSLLPGLWLTEVTADSYKVSECLEQ